jgi:hypothetical protein
MSHHSAEWLRGAKYTMQTSNGTREEYDEIVRLLAEAEAREASVPTAADLAVADELDMLSKFIQEYIGPDDARDDIRRICRNRAADLRRGVKRGPTAAEVIAAAERALLQVGQWDAFTQREKGLMKAALALIAKWKEAQRLLEGQ